MKKSVKIVVAIGAIMLTIAIIYAVLATGFEIKLPEQRCFANLDELAFLDEYVLKEIDDNEINLKGLETVSEYCIEVEYDGEHYDVFAYVFASKAEAELYYIRTNEHHKYASWYYITRAGTNVFRISGNSGIKNRESFKKLVYEHLSIIIDPFEEGQAGYSKIGIF